MHDLTVFRTSPSNQIQVTATEPRAVGNVMKQDGLGLFQITIGSLQLGELP